METAADALGQRIGWGVRGRAVAGLAWRNVQTGVRVEGESSSLIARQDEAAVHNESTSGT